MRPMTGNSTAVPIDAITCSVVTVHLDRAGYGRTDAAVGAPRKSPTTRMRNGEPGPTLARLRLLTCRYINACCANIFVVPLRSSSAAQRRNGLNMTRLREQVHHGQRFKTVARPISAARSRRQRGRITTDDGLLRRLQPDRCPTTPSRGPLRGGSPARNQARVRGCSRYGSTDSCIASTGYAARPALCGGGHRRPIRLHRRHLRESSGQRDGEQTPAGVEVGPPSLLPRLRPPSPPAARSGSGSPGRTTYG